MTDSPRPESLDASTPAPPTCPDCAALIDPSAWYCEACGGPLTPTVPPSEVLGAQAANSAQTQRLGTRASNATVCAECGGSVDADGYCQTCGAKAPSVRDHFEATPAPWVAAVCDRGLQHSRNEDAMAVWAADERAVLVVCDGVSTSVDSDVASLVAAERARDFLVEAITASPPVADLPQSLVEATAAANAAVVETTSEESTNAASATFAAAVVQGNRVHYANLGDSRVYFLGQTQQLLLSLDDSMAQAFIEEGMTRAEAEALPRAHAITKWLGRDAPDIVPRTGLYEATEEGWLIVCSDGLWNYASAPQELLAQVPADEAPLPLAKTLIAWANEQGGRDNITVALAKVPAPTEVPDGV